MVILAVETVTRGGSLALWHDGRTVATAGDPTRTHGERFPLEIMALVESEGLRISDVDLFAVTTGPGSFTGIRVGMATVQGLALAGRVRTVGIPTLDALTATWHLTETDPPLVAPCLDGMRGEVFVALHDTSATPEEAVPWKTLAPATVARPDEAAAALARLADGRRVAIVGDGALRHRTTFEAATASFTLAPAPRPLAEGAAWLASRHPDRGGSPALLNPTYLRRPDAELARDRAGSAGQRPAGSWAIRPADGPADIDAVGAIQAASFSSEWGAEAFRWEMEHVDVARLYVLTGASGRIEAYCSCWLVAGELHINSLAVMPEARRQGRGRHLVRWVVEQATAVGARSATLEVRASNSAALRLYDAIGFRVEGRRRDYYQHPQEDALILWWRKT